MQQQLKEKLRQELIKEASQKVHFSKMDKTTFRKALNSTLKNHKETIEALADR